MHHPLLLLLLLLSLASPGQSISGTGSVTNFTYPPSFTLLTASGDTSQCHYELMPAGPLANGTMSAAMKSTLVCELIAYKRRDLAYEVVADWRLLNEADSLYQLQEQTQLRLDELKRLVDANWQARKKRKQLMMRAYPKGF